MRSWSPVVCIHRLMSWQGLVCAELEDKNRDLFSAISG